MKWYKKITKKTALWLGLGLSYIFIWPFGLGILLSEWAERCPHDGETRKLNKADSFVQCLQCGKMVPLKYYIKDLLDETL